jgi:hypothetical protein
MINDTLRWTAMGLLILYYRLVRLVQLTWFNKTSWLCMKYDMVYYPL